MTKLSSKILPAVAVLFKLVHSEMIPPLTPGPIRYNNASDVVLTPFESIEIKEAVMDILSKYIETYPERYWLASVLKETLQNDQFSTISPDWLYALENTDRFICQGCSNIFPSATLDAFADYGCWCTFEDPDKLKHSGGPVMDEIDGFCRDLRACYKCTNVDAKSEGKPKCNSFQTTFSYGFTLLSSNPDIYQGGCLDAQDSCESRTCNCAINFINKINTITADSQFQHTIGGVANFDYESECGWSVPSSTTAPASSGPSNGTGHDRECCGDYPNRKPYLAGSTTECCQDTNVYNTLNLKCCSNGDTISFGDDCA